MQQAEFATSPEAQEAQRIQTLQAIGADYAKGLSSALASGNTDQVKQYIQQKINSYSQAGIGQDVLGQIQGDIAQLDTPTGMQELLAEANSVLIPAGTQSNFAPQISPVQTDIETGQKYVIKTDRNTGQSGRIDVKDAKGRTPEQEEQAAIRTSLLNDAAEVSKASFDQLKGVRSSISTIDEAISAIEKDATSGFFAKYFPSFKESTIALENTAQRMGLDVISATTFGALSEGELKLAMDTAMPRNLKPKALKKWLTERKNAKVKLARELSKMAITLGKGKVTIAEHLEDNATFDERSDEDILSEYGL